MNITDFLLERIAEDEAMARAAIEMMKGSNWANDGTCVASGEDAFWVDGLNVRNPGWVADHIARHDPARVLAECAAKRAILELWEDPSAGDSLLFDAADGGYILAIDRTVRTLAAVYANHPEYQAKWKVRA